MDIDRKFGIIDITGKEIIPCIYDFIEDFNEGLAIAEKDGKYGVLDKSGNIIIPFEYDGIRDFNNGLAVAIKDEKYGVIDKLGNIIIPFEYYDIGEFNENLAFVYKEDGSISYIDKLGNEVISLGYMYDYVNDFHEGLAVVGIGEEGERKWGAIDKSGREVIPLKYDALWDFSDGLAVACKNGKYGFIDRLGNEIIPMIYDEISLKTFHEGLAVVKKDGKYGVINKNGKQIVAPKYDWINDFNEGLAVIGIGSIFTGFEYGVIDNEGNELITPKYDWITDFNKGLAIVSKDKKYGIINKNGNPILPIEYDIIARTDEEGKYFIVLGDKCGVFDALNGDTINVTGVSLSETSKTVKIGESFSLVATVSPSNATNKSVVWSSSNTKIATVDKNGKVNAVGVGTVTITVKTVDGSYTANCVVTVNPIKVTGVKLNINSKTVFKGESFNLIAIVSPTNATNKSVTWSSSNPKVATVDKNGKVTALGVGTAEIIVKTLDGGYTTKCIVTVKQPIKVKKVQLNKTTLTLKKGSKYRLIAIVSPSNATNKKVTWSSSNTKVVKVDANGNITAIGKGTATITVKTVDGGYKATCKVVVK